MEIISYVFVLLFTFEISLRILAMGITYFYIPWNVFDFFLILVSFVGKYIEVTVFLVNYRLTVVGFYWHTPYAYAGVIQPNVTQ